MWKDLRVIFDLKPRYINLVILPDISSFLLPTRGAFGITIDSSVIGYDLA
jgi:hypothetical protein